MRGGVGNVSGKTVLSEMLLIEYLCKPFTFNAYISPSYSQGRKVFKELNTLLEGSGIVRKSNSSTLIIETIFGSTFQAFTMENPTAIRGYTVSGILVLDEVSFFPDILPDGSEPWSSVIMPITKARKPKVLAISTPKGKRGLFYDMYLKALAGEKGYKQITATIYDDELVSPEDIEQIKRNITPMGFAEEFMVEFLDSSMTFFRGFEKCFKPLHHSYEKTWIGVDLSGNGQDATILTKVNEKNEIEQFEISGTLDVKYQMIADIINRSENLQMAMIEVNGLGAPMYNEILKLVNEKAKVKEWLTTNSTKEEIISKLAVLVAQDAISCDEMDKSLFAEFGTFIARYTKSGRLQFEAMAGKHDDRIMSLALALRCKDDFSTKYTQNLGIILKI